MLRTEVMACWHVRQSAWVIESEGGWTGGWVNEFGVLVTEESRVGFDGLMVCWEKIRAEGTSKASSARMLVRCMRICLWGLLDPGPQAASSPCA